MVLALGKDEGGGRRVGRDRWLSWAAGTTGAMCRRGGRGSGGVDRGRGVRAGLVRSSWRRAGSPDRVIGEHGKGVHKNGSDEDSAAAVMTVHGSMARPIVLGRSVVMGALVP